MTIEETRQLLKESLWFFRPEDMFYLSGKGVVITGSLPMTLPAGSLRDSQVWRGLTVCGRPIKGIETYAHAREYYSGESVGFLVEIENLK